MADSILIPKDTPDWQSILTDTENARDAAQNAENIAKDEASDAQKHAQKTGSFTDHDGNSFDKGAQGWANDAKQSANNIGAVGGTDGTAESKLDSSTLEDFDGTQIDASNHTDELWFVADLGAYYSSNGTDWIEELDLTDASQLTGVLNDVQLPSEVALTDESNTFTQRQTHDADIRMITPDGNYQDHDITTSNRALVVKPTAAKGWLALLRGSTKDATFSVYGQGSPEKDRAGDPIDKIEVEYNDSGPYYDVAATSNNGGRSLNLRLATDAGNNHMILHTNAGVGIKVPPDKILGNLAVGQTTKINNGQRLLVGDLEKNVVVQGASDRGIIAIGSGGASASLMAARFDDGGANRPSNVTLARSRAAPYNEGGKAVQDGDQIGTIRAIGDDGSDLNASPAQIRAEVDGSVAQDAIPMRWVVDTIGPGGGPNRALTLDSSANAFYPNGNLVVGNGSAVGVLGYNPATEIVGTGNPDSTISVARFDGGGAARPSTIVLARSRDGGFTPGTIVQDGDEIGRLAAIGDDGTDLDATPATVEAFVDGSPAQDAVPISWAVNVVGAGGGTTEVIKASSSGLAKIMGNISQPGSNANPVIQFGNSGAGLYVNNSGEVVAVDESGNETVLT